MTSKAFAIIAGVGPGTVSTRICGLSIYTQLINQGASIARRFAKAYSVVLLGRNPDNYEPLVKEINTSGGQAVGISTDLSDAKSMNSTFDKIKDQYSGSALAAAVFNPGGGFVRKPFLEMTEEEYMWPLESQGLSSL